mmetsp:Transcript_59616/g.143161  ORF Transcript_59616/g.143161 Transcript_59616/m.143161 type:complete len:239 (+) Transcript_59616:1465-2181(+)
MYATHVPTARACAPMTSRASERFIIIRSSQWPFQLLSALRLGPPKPANMPRIRRFCSEATSAASCHDSKHMLSCRLKSRRNAPRIVRSFSAYSSHALTALTRLLPAKCAKARRALARASIMLVHDFQPLERARLSMCLSARSRGPTSTLRYSPHWLSALVMARPSGESRLSAAPTRLAFLAFSLTKAFHASRPLRLPLFRKPAIARRLDSRACTISSHEPRARTSCIDCQCFIARLSG